MLKIDQSLFIGDFAFYGLGYINHCPKILSEKKSHTHTS